MYIKKRNLADRNLDKLLKITSINSYFDFFLLHLIIFWNLFSEVLHAAYWNLHCISCSNSRGTVIRGFMLMWLKFQICLHFTKIIVTFVTNLLHRKDNFQTIFPADI